MNSRCSLLTYHIVLLAILTAGCSHTEPTRNDESESEFDVLGRYVTETNVFWDYQDYANEMLLGTFEYDDVVRQPYVPEGPVDVSCVATHRLGAIVLMHEAVASSSEGWRKPEGRGDIYSKKIIIDHSWQHSGRSDTDRRYDYRVRSGQYGIYSHGLTLTKKDRVSGTLTLTVSHKNQQLYQTSFRLVDCPNDS